MKDYMTKLAQLKILTLHNTPAVDNLYQGILQHPAVDNLYQGILQHPAVEDVNSSHQRSRSVYRTFVPEHVLPDVNQGPLQHITAFNTY